MHIKIVLEEYLRQCDARVPEKYRFKQNTSMVDPIQARAFRRDTLAKIYDAQIITMNYETKRVVEDVVEMMAGAEKPEDILAHMPVDPGEIYWVDMPVRHSTMSGVAPHYGVLLEGYEDCVVAMVFHSAAGGRNNQELIAVDPTSTTTLHRNGVISHETNEHMRPYIDKMQADHGDEIEDVVTEQASISITNIVHALVLLELRRQDQGTHGLFEFERSNLGQRAERRAWQKMRLDIVKKTVEIVDVSPSTHAHAHLQILEDQIKGAQRKSDAGEEFSETDRHIGKIMLDYDPESGFTLHLPLDKDKIEAQEVGFGTLLRRLLGSG